MTGMWLAGIGWSGDGYRVSVADRDSGRLTEESAWDRCGAAEVVRGLRALAARNNGALRCVIDSTTGTLDGHLLAAGLEVARLDPWQLPARLPGPPGPAGPWQGQDPAVLALVAMSDPEAATPLSLADGTLGGRDEETVATVAAAAGADRSAAALGRSLGHGARDSGQVALTFDDGPDPHTTGPILDVLRDHAVPATFFCVGMQARAYPELVERIVAEGHTLGNHTWSHPYLPDLTRDELLWQLERTGQVLAEVTGSAPGLLRPPYGGRSAATVGWIAGTGLTTVLWDVECDDWTLPGSAAIARDVTARARSGSIVLMHDGGGDRRQTAAALPTVLEALLERGLTCVTADRIEREDVHHDG